MFNRNLRPALDDALSDSPVVLLNGARQTGKTTLVEALTAARDGVGYLTLDDATVHAAALSDPAGFIAGLRGPVVIDEIQRAPELFIPIKASVDRNRAPGRFLLTGSANVLMLPRLSESLAGRMEILTLWPLSQGELRGVRETFIDRAFAAGVFQLKAPGARKSAGLGAASVFSAILKGGYPEIQKRSVYERRRAWFNSYIETILQRDVRDMSNIDALAAMPRLLSLLAARATGMLNFAELSSSCGIPQSSLKRYIALLENTFLIQYVRPWSANLGQRLVKAPKLYITDTGLMAHLLGVGEERVSQDGVQKGPLLENFVAMELRKQIAWSTVRPEMHHFRTHSGAEIDLVLEDARGRLVGIEIKSSSSVHAADFKWLRDFAEQTGKKFHRGMVLYTGEQAVSFGGAMTAAPLDELWA